MNGLHGSLGRILFRVKNKNFARSVLIGKSSRSVIDFIHSRDDDADDTDAAAAADDDDDGDDDDGDYADDGDDDGDGDDDDDDGG